MRALSEHERSVLYNLVRYPLYNNRELAEVTNLKLSTVTTIKRRLLETGYFRRIRVPLLHGLGCELLGVGFSAFVSSKSWEKRLKLGAKFDIEHPNVFWMLSELSQGMALQFAANYTDIKECIEGIEDTYAAHGFLGKSGVTFVPFSLRLIELINFFDYSFLLGYLFGIKDRPAPENPFASSSLRLSEREKKVFHSLVAHPEHSDKALASALGISRFSVARMKQKFEGRIMKTLHVVDIGKLGIRVVALLHMRFSIGTKRKTRREIIDGLLAQGAMFLALQHVECVAIVPFQGFDKYRAYMNRFSERHKEFEVLAEDPTILLFSIAESRFPKSHVYAPLVESVLGAPCSRHA